MSQDAKLTFSPEIIDKLGYYVYRLIDPRNGKIFYVGKGNGNRVFAHCADELASEAVGSWLSLAILRNAPSSFQRLRNRPMKTLLCRLPRLIFMPMVLATSGLAIAPPEGTWKEVKVLKLRTGTIREGMWIRDFFKATGRSAIGQVKPSTFPNYRYETALSSEPFINYDTWASYVVGNQDFVIRWRRFIRDGAHHIGNMEKIMSIKVWTGPPHPNPSGRLNSPY